MTDSTGSEADFRFKGYIAFDNKKNYNILHHIYRDGRISTRSIALRIHSRLQR